ncbi:site-2 protease family protein [Mahella sp.]|uniref:site-2 protease family protein n=1 Tax=Mahella sp. TaxID=2798721 RepID=UPI0025B7AE56|nr:site-2 protease family protein [Mahella sp.]MBZ4665743.1 peptidase [Mahella sp.]
MTFLYQLLALLIAFSFHEFAHALVADRLGDPTPRQQGRLTLDPMAHIDVIGFLLLLFAGFGWAKPVEIDPRNFKNRKWGDILVSIAGPLTNLMIALIAYIVLAFLSMSASFDNQIIANILWTIVGLNIGLAVFNILPIPPLDGYHVFKSLFFKYNVKFFWEFERYSFIVLIILIITGVIGMIMNPLMNLVINSMNVIVMVLYSIFF